MALHPHNPRQKAAIRRRRKGINGGPQPTANVSTLPAPVGGLPKRKGGVKAPGSLTRPRSGRTTRLGRR